VSRLTRLLNVFRSKSLEQDFDDELRFHLNQRIERNLKRGMTRAQAEADAYTRFGSVDRTKTGMRRARMLRVGERIGRIRPRAVLMLLSFVAGATLLVLLMPGLRSPASPPVYELSDGVSAPVPLEMRAPDYTAAAKRAKVQGVIHLRCVVRPEGVCSDVEIVRSLDQIFGLDEQALSAASRWRFRPGFLDGTAVSTRIVMELKFALR
jgi:TonB family protein